MPILRADGSFGKDGPADNRLVEMHGNHALVKLIDGGLPGYSRALNFHEVGPTRWSKDSSLLLWRVEGKWTPHVLDLVKIEKGKVRWQLDLLKRGQQAILTRTKMAAPERYRAKKEENAGYGSDFQDGFTVDVTAEGRADEAIALPLQIYVDLTSNPKENFAGNLNARLDAIVDEEGHFTVTKFQLSRRPGSSGSW